MSEEKLIRFYGTKWCPGSRRAKKVLINHDIKFDWVNIDVDVQGRKFVMGVNNGYRSVPTIVFPDGDILVEPSTNLLLDKLREMGFIP